MHRGWAQMDDAHIARLYLPGLDQKFVHGQTFLEPTATSPTATQLGMTFETIDDLFAGANLAISAEAMGFTQAVGLDTTTIYGIISKAAGSNVQFVKRVPEMKAPTWSLRDVTGAESLRRKLVSHDQQIFLTPDQCNPQGRSAGYASTFVFSGRNALCSGNLDHMHGSRPLKDVLPKVRCMSLK